jgi:CRISPR-associated helicase Cas3/CRISPR-associated endonuclease Cas3-HD
MEDYTHKQTAYYAHSKKGCTDKAAWQPLREHLENVAAEAGRFAKKFDCEDFGRIIGLFHDLGKYSEAFQKRLEGGPKVDHATAGALELTQRAEILGKLIFAYCVAGHHGGLPDTGSENDAASLTGRLKKTRLKPLPDYSAYKTEWEAGELVLKSAKLLPFPRDGSRLPFSIAFLTRMLYSCLVDADWLDTEAFMHKETPAQRGRFLPPDALLAKFNTYIQEKFANPARAIDYKREAIRHQCVEAAGGPKGFYKLTVPTGGGKTHSSMGFALNHAVKHGHDRIIYAIPYTSIIEQNAQEFRKIFGDDHILEHHSNFVFESDDTNETAQKLKFAAENWDIPLVATTNVQFFESLFANKSTQCRKLHNVANSVIILDEAQMLPISYLKPCLRALEELVNHYGCTVVLCTATQPALDAYMAVRPKEIIAEPEELEKFFQRVTVEHIGSRSDDELTAELLACPQALVIVNTRQHAKELYARLSDNEKEGTYHLSTLMCPVHRKKTIDAIKKRLKEHPDLPTRVISTQLIEAGVNIDFPVVYRSAAGLDSIIQSAGRCNREGKLPSGSVRVFTTTESYGKAGGHLKKTAQLGEPILEKFKENPICAAAVRQYFTMLYKVQEQQLDSRNILENFRLEHSGRELFQYKTAAQNFQLIDEKSRSVIIPYDDQARKLIAALKTADSPKPYLKQLQPYIINLFDNDYEALRNKGRLEVIEDLAEVLTDMNAYDSNTGLKINKKPEALFG